MKVTVASVALVGCVYGTGPTIGYGMKRGLFGGLEVGGGGAEVAQGWVGAQADAHGNRFYAIGVVGGANDNVTDGGAFGGVWVGGGLVYDDTSRDSLHGMFDASLDLGYSYSPGECAEQTSTVITAQVVLRYATEWEVAFAPKIEGLAHVCFD